MSMDIFGSFFRRRKPVDTNAEMQRQQEWAFGSPIPPIGWKSPQEAEAIADQLIDTLTHQGCKFRDGSRGAISMAVASHPWDIGAIASQVMPPTVELPWKRHALVRGLTK